MKTSPAGLEFIARQEGEVLHVYDDVAGHPTIGVGHLLRPGESYPNGITHEQAMSLLAEDVRVAEDAVSAAVKVSLTQNAFDALVDFAFNEGSGALHSSTAVRLLNAGMLDRAADALLMWDKDEQRGELVSDPGLLRRRQAERSLFLSPNAPPSDVA